MIPLQSTLSINSYFYKNRKLGFHKLSLSNSPGNKISEMKTRNSSKKLTFTVKIINNFHTYSNFYKITRLSHNFFVINFFNSNSFIEYPFFLGFFFFQKLMNTKKSESTSNTFPNNICNECI